MAVFEFSDDCRKVIAETIRFVAPKADVGKLLARCADHANRYLRSNTKEKTPPKVLFENTQRAATRLLMAQRAISDLDPTAAPLVEKHLGIAGRAKMRNLAMELVGRARATSEKVRPGVSLTPEEAALREFFVNLVRDWQLATGCPIRVSKLELPQLDISRCLQLMPKVRTGAEARAFYAIMLSVGKTNLSNKSLRYYLTYARKVLKKSSPVKKPD